MVSVESRGKRAAAQRVGADRIQMTADDYVGTNGVSAAALIYGAVAVIADRREKLGK